MVIWHGGHRAQLLCLVLVSACRGEPRVAPSVTPAGATDVAVAPIACPGQCRDQCDTTEYATRPVDAALSFGCEPRQCCVPQRPWCDAIAGKCMEFCGDDGLYGECGWQQCCTESGKVCADHNGTCRERCAPGELDLMPLRRPHEGALGCQGACCYAYKH